jgi:hypothetical protein
MLTGTQLLDISTSSQNDVHEGLSGSSEKVEKQDDPDPVTWGKTPDGTGTIE